MVGMCSSAAGRRYTTSVWPPSSCTWIHVEMVYGVASIWLHKTLTFEQAVLSYVAFSLFLFGLVKLKDRIFRNLAPPYSGTLVPSHSG